MTAADLRTMAVRTRRGAAHGLGAFYARPVGWVALLVTSLFLSYGGGGVMFWFHAVYRGEDGPPIPDVWHWLFDSTLGFLALTPALFFIMPLALHLLGRTGMRGERLKAAAYVGLVGVLFGVVAGPGPLLHGALVGRESLLGRLALLIFGSDPGVAARNAEAVAHTPLSSVLLQLAVGVPVYIAFGLLALAAVRAIARRTADE
jgi:hypothetical protein